ncbi:MAG: RdgB/HAM1 family non-canonical purine NTP pyrophosphatase [Fimbriimonadales bacterium]|nr:RdgB/HAM1 family non-canonical purine NTP pyrophosphatase [Fimbriimonadales bacterium]
MKIERLVIATHNLKKGGEMRTILSRSFPGLEVLTLEDFPGAPEPEETGSTYRENAILKARSACDHTGEWSVADDAGLEIDALNGAPGLYSKRFAGEETPFPEKMRRILEQLCDVPEERRTARFRVWVALAGPDGTLEAVEGVREGRIACEPAGEGGFGYDPIFFLPDLGCTMAQLTADQKHATSHRGMALAKLADLIRRLQKRG